MEKYKYERIKEVSCFDNDNDFDSDSDSDFEESFVYNI